MFDPHIDDGLLKAVDFIRTNVLVDPDGSLGDHPDQAAVLDDRKTSEASGTHERDGIQGRGLGRDGDGISLHDLADRHRSFRSLQMTLGDEMHEGAVGDQSY